MTTVSPRQNRPVLRTNFQNDPNTSNALGAREGYLDPTLSNLPYDARIHLAGRAVGQLFNGAGWDADEREEPV